MRSGVSIEDPARFDCDEGIEVGPDTVIEPNVRLRGRTRIGARCTVGAGFCGRGGGRPGGAERAVPHATA